MGGGEIRNIKRKVRVKKEEGEKEGERGKRGKKRDKEGKMEKGGRGKIQGK